MSPKTTVCANRARAPRAQRGLKAGAANPEHRPQQATMALASYRALRDDERACPWFDAPDDEDDSLSRLPALAERAYEELPALAAGAYEELPALAEHAHEADSPRLPALAARAHDDVLTLVSCGGEADPLVEPELLRRYEICARVGGTSRCVVYKAYERSRRRFVALKIMEKCFGDRESAQRCYREVAYLHALQGHPCVGRLRRIYVSEAGAHAALALDYFGTDLRHAILADRLGPRHRTCVARQVFAALAFCHDAKIAHRDVRPANIVLDERCQCQLVDFSSAKFLGADDTCSAALDGLRGTTDGVGCSSYRPPEALLGSPRRGGRAGDVWAAGCILIEMETSVPAFAGLSTLDVVTRQCWLLGAPAPRELRTLHCTADADAVVARAAARAALMERAPTILELIDRAHFLRASLDATQAGEESDRDASLVRRDARLLELKEEARRGAASDLALACCAALDPRLGAHDALRHPLFADFAAAPPFPVFEDSKDGLYEQLQRHCGDGLDAGGPRLAASEYRARVQAYVRIDEVPVIKCRPPDQRAPPRAADDESSRASSYASVSWAESSRLTGSQATGRTADDASEGTYSFVTPPGG